MKKYGHLSYLIGAVAGLLATAMVFLPVIGTGDGSFTGLQLILGYELVDWGTFANGSIAFNILNVLAFLLPLLAAVILVFVKRGHRLAFVLFLVSLVLVILIPEVTEIRVVILGNTTYHEIDWNMFAGLWLAIVFNAIGLVVTLYQNVIDFRK